MKLEDYSKYYIQCSDHYLIPKDEFAWLVEENQELKKKLEEYKEQVNKGLYNTCLPYTTGYKKAIKDKETQQKDFIKYLEDIISWEPVVVEKILQKYKEIIGDDKQ